MRLKYLIMKEARNVTLKRVMWLIKVEAKTGLFEAINAVGRTGRNIKKWYLMRVGTNEQYTEYARQCFEKDRQPKFKREFEKDHDELASMRSWLDSGFLTEKEIHRLSFAELHSRKECHTTRRSSD